MTISNTTEAEILDCYFNQTNITAPTAIWASLHSADPGETGASELASASAYARVNVTTAFGAASGGALSNSAEVAFPEATGTWSAATHLGIWTASTAGTFLWGGPLTAARTATTGVVIRFPIGDIDVALD